MCIVSFIGRPPAPKTSFSVCVKYVLFLATNMRIFFNAVVVESVHL